MNSTTPQLVHYIPIVTTIISFAFGRTLWRRYKMKGGLHLLWWSLGFFCYGAGTMFEGTITLFGNSIFLTKGWYIAGAVFGGYPLAQGSVYLHLRKETAHKLTAVTLVFVSVLSLLVILSPVRAELMQPHRPGGAILAWQWVRMLTPILNTYAAVFLIGTAIWSAVRFFRLGTMPNRALGNTAIAFGAILPGIGGAYAKAGVIEALYIGEFIGLLFIWAGYRLCLRDAPVPAQSSAGASGLRVVNG